MNLKPLEKEFQEACKGITNICVKIHAKKAENQRICIDFTKIMCILIKFYKEGNNFVIN